MIEGGDHFHVDEAGRSSKENRLLCWQIMFAFRYFRRNLPPALLGKAERGQGAELNPNPLFELPFWVTHVPGSVPSLCRASRVRINEENSEGLQDIRRGWIKELYLWRGIECLETGMLGLQGHKRECANLCGRDDLTLSESLGCETTYLPCGVRGSELYQQPAPL